MGVCAQDFRRKSVGGLHEPGARDEVGDDLTRGAPAEIGIERVGRVDDSLAVPLQAGDGLGDVAPWHGYGHERECRGLANRPSQNTSAESGDHGCERLRAGLFAIATFLPARSAVLASACPMRPAPMIPTVAVRSVVRRSKFKSSLSLVCRHELVGGNAKPPELAFASNYSAVDSLPMATDRVTNPLDELQFRVWREFVYAYSVVVPTLDRELINALGISFNQFEVLVWLRRAGTDGLRMSDLASRVVLSPSGVTRAVDQLERKGLVERCVFEGDKRGYLATVTPEGKTFLRKATTFHLDGLRKHFLDHLNRTQLTQMSNALEAILDGEGAPLPPLTSTKSSAKK